MERSPSLLRFTPPFESAPSSLYIELSDSGVTFAGRSNDMFVLLDRNHRARISLICLFPCVLKNLGCRVILRTSDMYYSCQQLHDTRQFSQKTHPPDWFLLFLAQNILGWLKRGGCGELLSKAGERGVVSVRRAFGDFSNPCVAARQVELQRHGFDLVHTLHPAKGKSNSADIRYLVTRQKVPLRLARFVGC